MEDLQGGALALEHRYDIGRPAGSVGFTSVYRGVQHPFGREVSILVFDVLAESGADAELVSRMRTSAEAYARLEHDGVVRAIDVGELAANLPFVVVDRAPGVRLATHLDKEGTMAPDEVVALTERLAAVLETAHAAGVIHGSLAPAWVHLEPGAPERAAIEFFGLGLTVAEMRSMEGAYMGFDAVCALGPEMFDDDAEPTVEGDVYALAAIAYRALGGIHPFFDDLSDTSEGLLRLQRDDAASLEDYGIDEEIAAVVARGLSRDPDDRFESPNAFARALHDAVIPATVESRTEEQVLPIEDDEPSFDIDGSFDPNVPSPKGGLLAVAILLLLVTNVGWYLFNPATNNVPETTVETEVLPNGVNLFSDPPGAKIVEVREDGEKELGETPIVVDPSIRESGKMELKIERVGFVATRIIVRKGDDADEVVVKLLATD